MIILYFTSVSCLGQSKNPITILWICVVGYLWIFGWFLDNLQSYPPSLHLFLGMKGMIHLLVGLHVQKPDSVFFSYWSYTNTCKRLCSDWLSYLLRNFRLVQPRNKKQIGGDNTWSWLQQGRVFFGVNRSPDEFQIWFSEGRANRVFVMCNLFKGRCFGVFFRPVSGKVRFIK